MKEWLAEAEEDVNAGEMPRPLPSIQGLSSPPYQAPVVLYRGMIHPVQPYAIRGTVWYQGESNAGDWKNYQAYMQALVQGWRTVWGKEDLPFYFVQLANFHEDNLSPAGGDGFAGLREAQRESMSLPHTGMAVTIDIGNGKDIHPRNKQDVGARFSTVGLNSNLSTGWSSLRSCGPKPYAS